MLLDRVHEALARDREASARRAEIREIEKRLGRLTPRERQVLDSVLAGRTSLEIAEALRLSPKTVHTHRAAIMRKMKVKSVAELAGHVASARTPSAAG